MRNPEFDAVLRDMERLHDRKNEDYAEEGNPYSNFERAAELAGITPAQAVMTLMGVKVARLEELNKGKTANFEPFVDTVRDLAVYSVILLAMLGAYDINEQTLDEILAQADEYDFWEEGNLREDEQHPDWEPPDYRGWGDRHYPEGERPTMYFGTSGINTPMGDED